MNPDILSFFPSYYDGSEEGFTLAYSLRVQYIKAENSKPKELKNLVMTLPQSRSRE